MCMRVMIYLVMLSREIMSFEEEGIGSHAQDKARAHKSHPTQNSHMHLFKSMHKDTCIKGTNEEEKDR